MRIISIATSAGLCVILAGCNPSTPNSSSATAVPSAAESTVQDAPPAAVGSTSPASELASNPSENDASSANSQTRYFDCNGSMLSESLSNGGNDATVQMNGASYAMKRAESKGSSRYTDAKGNALVNKGKTETTLIMSGEKDIVCKEEFKKS